MRDIDRSAGLIPMSMFMWSRNWFLLATRNPPCESSSGLSGVRSHSSGSFLWLLSSWWWSGTRWWWYLLYLAEEETKIDWPIISGGCVYTAHLWHGWLVWMSHLSSPRLVQAQAKSAAGAVWGGTNGLSIVHCNYFPEFYICWFRDREHRMMMSQGFCALFKWRIWGRI